ncbi:hypothetical protein QBC46DRAFT_273405 [Diplogelasinospora grovesii]|uniref:Uncharacterized protein n=1 Tax=Diplogelasinospora grovesii TaxID=303347 RepID=A0AAN6MYL9_9PEZI|nr:hypothetical protein QBC46DRAFT_273405 [Diplogelasinospora grovesii]
MFFRKGIPFIIYDKLLYNIWADSIRSLYIPYSEVKKVLKEAYDKKYHLKKYKMLYDLRGLSILNKTYLVKSYI